MSTKVKLFFREFKSSDIEKCISNYKLIRLMCKLRLKTHTDWTPPIKAIVDTGAHISTLPFSLWKSMEVEVIGESKLRGIIPKKECEVSVAVGKVKCMLVDMENHTNEIEIHAFLSLIDEIPLIIGFKDLLEKFKVCFDYSENEAFIEEKKIK